MLFHRSHATWILLSSQAVALPPSADGENTCFLNLTVPESASLFLVVHLRMTGRLFLVPDSEAIERHTRLALMLDDGLALRFDDPRKFGRVWLTEDPESVTGGMGPDALDRRSR